MKTDIQTHADGITSWIERTETHAEVCAECACPWQCDLMLACSQMISTSLLNDATDRVAVVQRYRNQLATTIQATLHFVRVHGVAAYEQKLAS